VVFERAFTGQAGEPRETPSFSCSTVFGDCGTPVVEALGVRECIFLGMQKIFAQFDLVFPKQRINSKP